MYTLTKINKNVQKSQPVNNLKCRNGGARLKSPLLKEKILGMNTPGESPCIHVYMLTVRGTVSDEREHLTGGLDP